MWRIRWRSFFLGAASCGLLLFVLGAATTVWMDYKLRAQEREAEARLEAAMQRAEEAMQRAKEITAIQAPRR